MAQLLSSLAFAGARDSTGAPVSSGVAWFFEVGGGTTQALVYGNEAGTTILTQPVVLDAGGRAVVYTIEPVRLLIQDSTGADVADHDQANVTRAESVQVDNAGFTDGYLNGVLDSIALSTGGDDAMYQESSGATARTIKAKFAEAYISVKDFGAKGDGLAVDTTAVQAAINRAGFLGGGVVYFPPGTYLVDQMLSVGSAAVVLRGTGQSSSIVKMTSATLDTVSFTANGGGVRSMRFTTSSASSAKSIKAAALTGFTIDDVKVDGSATGVNLTSVVSCFIGGNSVIGGTTQAVSATACVTLTILGCQLTGGAGLVCSNNTNVNVFGSGAASLTFDTLGSYYVVIGCSITPNFTGATQPSNFYQYGNGAEGQTIIVATGATATAPDLSFGSEITISASSGGAGTATVPFPTKLPPTARKGYAVTMRFVNAAGGAVTWALDPLYKLAGGAAPAGTDGTTTMVLFQWEGAGTKLREVARANSTT